MATALNTLSAQAYPGPIAAFELASQPSPLGDDVLVERKQGIRSRATTISPPPQGTSTFSERHQLILDHLNLVKAIAVRVRQRLPVNVDLEDVVQAGVLGLIDAATKFNVDKQVSFSSYAKHRIRGAILDSLRQSDTASRDLRRRQRAIEAATSALTAKLNRTPSDMEVAACLGITVDHFRRTMVLLSSLGDVSANTRWTDHDDGLREPEYPSSPETQPDDMCADEQRRDALRRAMVSLPERYGKVVTMYYTEEMTMKEIGAVLGINESRVSQIHKAALEKMSVALHKAGISSTNAL